jgi:uncharacterized protein (DUF1697 family)
MATWIALFRGINVGGNQMLPMKNLVAMLEHEGFTDVRTYIQSGNVVFQSSKGTASGIGKRIGELIVDAHGFQPKIMVLSVKELQQAAASNPFPAGAANPKSLHLFFLAEVPKKPDLESLDKIKVGKEAFALKGKVFYLHTPEGFGVSKLGQRVERYIGVDATARNWNTVCKLLEMVGGS